ncbi:hypothetical protein JTB14_033352 [Gonioctena quinquepunctata]|nr:hypothetical protein JTB14_033352 [Gonioctena quinquepunctata]
MVETAQRLRVTGFKIDYEWVGSLLLAGLSEKYNPMTMAIEHSGIEIMTDSIKKRLDMEIDADNTGNSFSEIDTVTSEKLTGALSADVIIKISKVIVLHITSVKKKDITKRIVRRNRQKKTRGLRMFLVLYF